MLETNDFGTAGSPRIAFDSSKNAIVVWEHFDGPSTDDVVSIWSNRFDGEAWTGTVLIENENTLSTSTPRISFDSEDEAVAVWYQHSAGLRSSPFIQDIWANRYRSNWGVPNKVVGEMDQPRRFGELKTDNQGDVYIMSYVGGNLFSSVSLLNSSGDVWDEIEIGAGGAIINGGMSIVSGGQVAFSENGTAVSIFLSWLDGEQPSLVSRFFDGTNWDDELKKVETDDAGPASNAQIEFDGDGNAIAVWQQSDGTRDNIWANRFDGTNWGNAERIEREDQGNATNPKIVFDGSGNATVIWEYSDGENVSIWTNRFDGTSWGNALVVASHNDEDVLNTRLAVDERGNAIAVWQQNDNIWAIRFTISSASWGTATLLENDSGKAKKTDIGLDSDGNAFAVWSQSDGTRSNIWVNRFE